MTNYVVLRKHPSGEMDLWQQVTAQYAHSSRHAVRMTVDGGGGSGTYIAVPLRFWVPHTVEVVPKTAIKFL